MMHPLSPLLQAVKDPVSSQIDASLQGLLYGLDAAGSAEQPGRSIVKNARRSTRTVIQIASSR